MESPPDTEGGWENRLALNYRGDLCFVAYLNKVVIECNCFLAIYLSLGQLHRTPSSFTTEIKSLNHVTSHKLHTEILGWSFAN
jgi:hypothetical protein